MKKKRRRKVTVRNVLSISQETGRVIKRSLTWKIRSLPSYSLAYVLFCTVTVRYVQPILSRPITFLIYLRHYRRGRFLNCQKSRGGSSSLRLDHKRNSHAEKLFRPTSRETGILSNLYLYSNHCVTVFQSFYKQSRYSVASFKTYLVLFQMPNALIEAVAKSLSTSASSSDSSLTLRPSRHMTSS